MHAAAETIGLRFHHTGCLVADLEAERARLAGIGLFGPVSPIYEVDAQKVRVCFVGPPGGPCLELVETRMEKGILPGLLRRGQHFYHAAYEAPNFDGACAALEARGLRRVNEFASPAFGGARCAFFLDESGLLFEIIDGGARRVQA